MTGYKSFYISKRLFLEQGISRMSTTTHTPCQNLDKCGFFAKYSAAHERACEGFINLYCRGAKQNECKRKAYRQQHNAPPPDEMMPNGGLVPLSTRH
jgi:hypothetical protein